MVVQPVGHRLGRVGGHQGVARVLGGTGVEDGDARARRDGDPGLARADCVQQAQRQVARLPAGRHAAQQFRAGGAVKGGLALDVYTHRIRSYIGAYAAQLGRVDAFRCDRKPAGQRSR